VKKGFYPRHHRPLLGVPHADGAARARLRGVLRQGRLRIPGPWGKSVSRNITSHKEKGSAPGATTRSSARSPRACARTARRSSRRWATRSTPT
jgi:hypothetical protein